MNSAQPQTHDVAGPASSSKAGRVLMSVEGLRKDFGGQPVLDNIELSLHEGEIVLLQGVNGSAKTTLLNILTGNLAPDAGTIHLSVNGNEEVFHFPRRSWQDMNVFDRFTPEHFACKGVGREWQDIRLFSSQNLRDNLAVAAPRHVGENPLAVLFRREAVKENEHHACSEASVALDKLGLHDREGSSADKVSLGQAKRAAIARAVQAGARILFLDEPLAGLDEAGTEQVLEMLKDLADRQRLTLVIVEHVFNVSKILEFATSAWTLKNGSLSVESAATVKMQLAGLSIGPVAEIQKRLPPGAVLAQKTSLNGADLLIFSRNKRTDDPPLLEVKELVVYRGNRLVLGSRDELGNIHGISFALHRGDTGLMLAANGHGKTTLAESLAGLVKIASGQIRFDGVPIEQMPVWERAVRGLLFLPARNHTFADLSVAESLKLAGINDCPQSLKLLLHRRVSQLSLGEKQRLAFECALRKKNYILGVLDEPFSALDGANVQALFEHIQNAKDCAFLICLPNQIRQEI